MEYGTVIFNGVEYELLEDAYLENYGDGACWFAKAKDDNGAEYLVRWEDKGIEVENNDYSDCADWDNPVSVIER